MLGLHPCAQCYHEYTSMQMLAKAYSAFLSLSVDVGSVLLPVCGCGWSSSTCIQLQYSTDG